MNKVEIIKKFMNNNFLISPDFFNSFDGDVNSFEALKKKECPIVLDNDLLNILKKNKTVDINWLEFEKSRSLSEKGRNDKTYRTFLNILHDVKDVKEITSENFNNVKRVEDKLLKKEVVIVRNYIEDDSGKKKEEKDFIQYFRARYNELRDILIKRPELQNVISINRVLNKKGGDLVAVMGLIADKRTTKKGHIILEIEDPTGKVNVIVIKSKERLYKKARDLVLDEMIGVVGGSSEKVIFANDIHFPDVPSTKESKRTSEDVCVAFISDIHIGSNNFLEKEFLDFIDWLNGNKKNDLELSKKIKYLLVAGDLVDGVGIYPDQEKQLTIKNVIDQYNKLAEYLSKIRKDIYIILTPGNHDALRLAQPQPVLDKKYAGSLYELDNTIFTTNPAYVNIHSSEGFPGFDILVYHGNSFHYYMSNVEGLREKDVKNNPRHVLKFLLEKRHLAPTHTSTLYIPDNRKDPMVIDKIPDVILSGELHRVDVGDYNNIITVNSSCWQSATDYEIKLGNNPLPGKVPVLNLKTREMKVVSFYDENK